MNVLKDLLNGAIRMDVGLFIKKGNWYSGINKDKLHARVLNSKYCSSAISYENSVFFLKICAETAVKINEGNSGRKAGKFYYNLKQKSTFRDVPYDCDNCCDASL